MASPLTSYFKSVSVSDPLTTAFQQREPGQKTVKRPVGREAEEEKRRRREPAETASDAVVATYYTR